MAKKVRYNGGKQRFRSCTNPDSLTSGEVYTVILSKDKAYQTNYVLQGVEGEFNSVWFETVEEEEPLEIGVAGEIPAKDQPLSYSLLKLIDSCLMAFPRYIDNVECVNYLGSNIYAVRGEGKYIHVLVG